MAAGKVAAGKIKQEPAGQGKPSGRRPSRGKELEEESDRNPLSYDLASLKNECAKLHDKRRTAKASIKEMKAAVRFHANHGGGAAPHHHLPALPKTRRSPCPGITRNHQARLVTPSPAAASHPNALIFLLPYCRAARWTWSGRRR